MPFIDEEGRGSLTRVGSVTHLTLVGTLGRVGYIGTLQKVGTVRYIQAGSLGRIERVGTIGRLMGGAFTGSIGRVGTLQKVGTIRYLQAGSLGRVERVGTIGHVPRVGTIRQVGRVGTAHVGTVPTEAFSRRGVYTAIRDRVRLGAGSVWLGSWQHVGSYEVKTFLFNVGNIGTTGGGSVAIMTGLQGTGVSGGVGTYFGPVRIGKGSYTPLTFTEAVRYARPWIRQHGAGAVSQHGGTTSFHLGVRP